MQSTIDPVCQAFRSGESNLPFLSINTSGSHVSLALMDGTQVIDQVSSQDDFRPTCPEKLGQPAGAEDQRGIAGASPPPKPRKVFPPGAAVVLAPLIQQLLDRQQLTMAQMSLICVAIGPGGFTGLRVGVVTAKTLAYASGAELMAIDTLEALAHQCLAAQRPVVPIGGRISVAVNAQRQQLFARSFCRVGESELRAEDESQLWSRGDWLASLQVPQWVTGPGLSPLLTDLEGREGIEVAAAEVRVLSAATVGRIGWERFQAGQRDDFWTLEPVYFRPSTAEEVADARNR